MVRTHSMLLGYGFGHPGEKNSPSLPREKFRHSIGGWSAWRLDIRPPAERQQTTVKKADVLFSSNQSLISPIGNHRKRFWSYVPNRRPSGWHSKHPGRHRTAHASKKVIVLMPAMSVRPSLLLCCFALFADLCIFCVIRPVCRVMVS